MIRAWLREIAGSASAGTGSLMRDAADALDDLESELERLAHPDPTGAGRPPQLVGALGAAWGIVDEAGLRTSGWHLSVHVPGGRGPAQVYLWVEPASPVRVRYAGQTHEVVLTDAGTTDETQLSLLVLEPVHLGADDQAEAMAGAAARQVLDGLLPVRLESDSDALKWRSFAQRYSAAIRDATAADTERPPR